MVQALYGFNVGRSVARGDLPTPEEYSKVQRVRLSLRITVIELFDSGISNHQTSPCPCALLRGNGSLTACGSRRLYCLWTSSTSPSHAWSCPALRSVSIAHYNYLTFRLRVRTTSERKAQLRAVPKSSCPRTRACRWRCGFPTCTWRSRSSSRSTPYARRQPPPPLPPRGPQPCLGRLLPPGYARWLAWCVMTPSWSACCLPPSPRPLTNPPIYPQSRLISNLSCGTVQGFPLSIHLFRPSVRPSSIQPSIVRQVPTHQLHPLIIHHPPVHPPVHPCSPFPSMRTLAALSQHLGRSAGHQLTDSESLAPLHRICSVKPS